KIGSIAGEDLGNNFQIRLESRDPLRRGLFQSDMRFNRQSGEFRLLNVIPGSYDILARATASDGRQFYARVPMEIGTAQPEPVEVMLQPAMTLTGTIAMEGEQKVALESLRVILNSLEPHLGWPQPSAQVQKDGT